MNTLQFYLLGPVQFCRDNQLVDFTIAKVQALLAYLAVTDAAQTREHLLDLLWRESHPEAARKNLRNNLWRLRQKLGDDVLLTDWELVTLSSAVWSDVSAFESGLHTQLASGPQRDDQLQQIIELWRGPLLEGVTLSEAPDFELWLRGERERLGQLYVQGLKQLLAIYHQTSQWQRVIAIAQRGLAYDQTLEPMHVALMEAHAQRGERTAALRQYDTLRTLLERELAIAPLPETQALRTSILSGQFTIDHVPLLRPSSEQQPLSTEPTIAASKPRGDSNRPFIGRQREWGCLDQALQAAAVGQLQIVLLSGELGIGKSTLWQQWSAQLPPETLVLETRCLDTTQSLPFAPLTGLFGSQICLERIATPESPVSAVWLTELARLHPEIREHRPDLPQATPLPAAEERRRLFEAFIQILRAHAATPLLLFIDDLHWADHATLDWLVYLTDRMREEALLLVMAYRTNEGVPELAEHIAKWQRKHHVQQIQLSQLTIQETTALVTALGGHVEMIDYLHTQSGGNPYYLTELAHVYPDGTPAALVDLLNARLRSLPEGAQRLLQVAAILEPKITFELLQYISKGSEDKTLDDLDTLLDSAILVERGEHYEFAHPLLANVVRDGFSTARRQILHKRVAHQLLAVHADNVEAIAGQLTTHFAAAREPLEAARYADMAAEHAFQMAAMSEAVAFHQQAYTLEPTPARQLAFGYALLQLPGQLQEARETMQAAFTAAESQQDQAGMVEAGLRLAISYLSTEEGEKVLDWAERISSNLGDIENVESRATVQFLIAQGKFHTVQDMTEPIAHFAAATQLATEHQINSNIALQSWFGWGNLAVQCGDFVAAQEKFQRALALAQASQNIYFEALSYNNLGYAVLLADDLATARSTIETGLDFVNRYELMQPRQYLYTTRGELALADGEFDAAERWFERGIEEAQRYENAIHLINIRANLGRVALALGDLDQAEELLTTARRAIPQTSAQHLQLQIDLWLAELYLRRQELAAAQRVLTAVQQQLAGSQRKALQAKADQIAEQLHLSEKRRIVRPIGTVDLKHESNRRLPS